MLLIIVSTENSTHIVGFQSANHFDCRVSLLRGSGLLYYTFPCPKKAFQKINVLSLTAVRVGPLSKVNPFQFFSLPFLKSDYLYSLLL